MNTAKKETAANILIDKQDLDFYKRLGVPPPKLSPQQRRMRRLSFRNESSIYRRRCSATGKQIISMYSEDKPFIVYDNDSWWQDDWNAMDYGRNFNFELPFSTQFEKLFLDVPKMARIQQGEQINSQFTNCASYNKNSYLIFSIKMKIVSTANASTPQEVALTALPAITASYAMTHLIATLAIVVDPLRTLKTATIATS